MDIIITTTYKNKVVVNTAQSALYTQPNVTICNIKEILLLYNRETFYNMRIKGQALIKQNTVEYTLSDLFL